MSGIYSKSFILKFLYLLYCHMIILNGGEKMCNNLQKIQIDVSIFYFSPGVSCLLLYGLFFFRLTCRKEEVPNYSSALLQP